MNQEILASAVGSKLHENWAISYRQTNPGEQTRIKTTKDETWILTHGTNEVDILNTNFSDLPLDWQGENLIAGQVAAHLVLGFIEKNGTFFPTDEEYDTMASIVHENWVERNSWIKTPGSGSEHLAVPYSDLPLDEQLKDIAHIKLALATFDELQQTQELSTSNRSL